MFRWNHEMRSALCGHQRRFSELQWLRDHLCGEFCQRKHLLGLNLHMPSGNRSMRRCLSSRHLPSSGCAIVQEPYFQVPRGELLHEHSLAWWHLCDGQKRG